VIRIIQGDCREMLATLPDASVQCCVTSPPYFGLRSYGIGTENGEIGLEATPDEFVAQMVAVFREVRRVLRDDGTLWLNLGDSYATSPAGNKTPSGISQNTPQRLAAGLQSYNTQAKSYGDAKPKDLMLMPARVALALQADGWWLRSDIIWAKPNPMPESVTDRPTSAHEHVFLLAKQPRYYFDADAVREVGTIPAGTLGAKGSDERFNAPGVNSRPPEYKVYDGTRNCRNVWTIATAPFSEAHFATFPPELAERCIKAGTSERGCCAACGAPWVRVVDVSYTDAHRGMVGNQRKVITDERVMHAGREGDVRMDKHVSTTGWAPTCKCDAPTVPCTVLDPFAGAFTTALVADRLQRHAIGIELSPEYCAMARRRLEADAGMFAEVEAA
jgi:DNA modification methylase